MNDFAFLHVYSGHSFLRSGLSVEHLVSASKKRGLAYVALTDLESASGFPELNTLCLKHGLTPIFGIDLVVEENLFTCIVESEEGYRHLIRLLHLSSANELDLTTFKSLSAGLTVVLNPEQSKLKDILEEHPRADFLFALQKGIDHFYIGVPYDQKRKDFVDGVRSFAASHSYDLVAFPHVRYEKEDDAIVTLILDAIHNDSTLVEKKWQGDERFLEEKEIDSYYYASEKAAIGKILDGIHFEFSKKRGALLRFPCPEGLDSKTYLRQLVTLSLQRHGLQGNQEYEGRLEYELSVIERMGYCDYFLVVADYVNFAKTHGISVGPGRGSGAGSLVSYLLNIVTVDPIRYGLLFERFLNPERKSMPDIDVDFSDVRRDEVVEYLKQRYGEGRVANIITMQTLGPRASIRDIGRVYGYEARQIDLLAKAVEYPYESLRNNYRKSAKFRSLVDSDPYYLEIVALAAKIEGLPRQSGLHAAGVVLNDAPLDEAIPVKNSEGTGLVVDFEMNHLEEQGFLKMDILGLRNLTYIDECLRLVNARHNLKLIYDDIPYDSSEAIDVIARGKTMGLFQLESPGMNRAIAEVKPTKFADIVAIISLFRPGPMANIPSYGRRLHGLEKVTYPSPRLEKILASTYGIIIYQEQVMQIVRELAGFSFGQADLLRRAISKKDANKLASLREDYLKGCKQNGVDDKTAKDVYDLIYKFADYGFNKSHAVAYAVITCQMAYLKAHYPLEFYAAILGGTPNNDPKFLPLISEIKSMGVSFSTPLINKADLRFLPSGNKLVFPFISIHGIQSNLCVRLVEERTLNGPYEDLFDFAVRNKSNGLTQSNFIKLIDSGCFDELDPNRAKLRLASSNALRYAEMLVGSSGNEALLGLNLPKPIMAEVAEDKMLDLLLEKENLGLMISGSPLQIKGEEIKAQGLRKLSDVDKSNGFIEVAAIVGGVKTIITKKGTKMAFLTLYDEEATKEFTMFADAYDQSYPALKEGNLVKAKVKKDTYKRDGYLASAVEVL